MLSEASTYTDADLQLSTFSPEFPLIINPPKPDSQAEMALEQLEHASKLFADLWDDDADLGFDVPSGFLLSVVIPVYNEARTIVRVIERIRDLPLNTEIIVVDDCSTDGTREILQSLSSRRDFKLILKSRNEGKGAALRAGFEAACGDVIVVQDADLEYDPLDIPDVIQPIVEQDADVVYGSRFLTEEPQARSWMHRLINYLLTRASNRFTGLQLTDMETCYKAFRSDVLQDLQLRQNRFGFEPEVTAKIARRGYTIMETPISYCARGYADGKKIGVRDAFNAFYCIIRYGLMD